MEPTAPAMPRRLAWFTIIAPLVLYAVTAARTLQGGDSPEFSYLAEVGGVAHPPGYPLYVAILRALRWVPISPPILRVSLISSLFGAVAVHVVARLSWRLTRDLWASGLAALALAVAPIHWRLAGIPEVFALHAALVSLVAWSSLELAGAPPERLSRWALLVGLFSGLGASNHHTIVFCAPLVVGAVISVAARCGMGAALGALGRISLASVLCLAPYLLLLRWPSQAPAHGLVWGHTETWPGLVNHFLRRDYGTFRLSTLAPEQSAGAWYQIGRLCLTLLRSFYWAPALAGVAGLVALARRFKAWGAGLSLSIVLAGPLFAALMRLPRSEITDAVGDRFFLMALVLFAPAVAFGWALVSKRLPARPMRIAAVSLLVAGIASTYPAANWRGDRSTEAFVRATFADLPEGAVVVGTTDTFYGGFPYVQHLIAARPDITYFEIAALKFLPALERYRANAPRLRPALEPVPNSNVELVVRLMRVAPVYVLPHLREDVLGVIGIVPEGLLLRMVPPTSPPYDLDLAELRLLKALSYFDNPLPEPVDAWSNYLRSMLAVAALEVVEGWRKAGNDERADALLLRLGPFLPTHPIGEGG